jgi:hypothetical protein
MCSCGRNINENHHSRYYHNNNIPQRVNECDPVKPFVPRNCPKPKKCVDVVPCVPKCRKSVKDAYRIIHCPPPCESECKPRECVRGTTKCIFASVKDAYRYQKPCFAKVSCC